MTFLKVSFSPERFVVCRVGYTALQCGALYIGKQPYVDTLILLYICMYMYI